MIFFFLNYIILFTEIIKKQNKNWMWKKKQNEKS